jgi:hypothetical protein
MLHRVALVRTEVSEDLIQLLVTAKVVPSTPILVTLMMEATRSSETSVLTRATLRNIQESCIVHSRSVLRLQVTANVPSSPILVTLIMETIYSSEMSILTRATRRNIPEDDILHSHRRENLASYITLTGWVL